MDETSFVADRCRMLPFEVVVRREAHGSYLKRYPNVIKGFRFSELLVEFFLKTTGKRWGDYELPVDDPLMEFVPSGMALYRPDQPIDGQTPFLVLEPMPDVDYWDRMKSIARETFWVLEQAWTRLDRRLVDFKIEVGLTQDQRLLVADVIDNDSWRLVHNGHYEDKQVYRDGGDLNEVTIKFRRVAALTEQFFAR